MTIILIAVVLVILLAGSAPAYGYSRSWGYAPFGGVGILLFLFVLWILFMHGRI